jgi:hypothetical protein
LKHPILLGILVFIVFYCVLISIANASCRIINETQTSFRVTSDGVSGSTSGQVLEAHSSTSIQAGEITGESPDGASFSGSCEDGDEMVLRSVNRRGEPSRVPILTRRR